MTTYSLEIKHCNSIESANIKIVKDTLNIKYGPNGLGKSSIAKAITSGVANDGSIQNLKPFKYRKLHEQFNPSVSGIDELKSVLVFDDSYVSQFVFQRDEVVKNSYEIFIKTDAFLAAMQEIDLDLKGIKSGFDGNQVLSQAISDLKELHEAFSVTKTGSISKSSKGYKAFGSGNKIENIPEKLKSFSDFIQSDQPSNWISWQAKGNSFLKLSDNCPYCSTSFVDSNNKDVAQLVAKEYDSKSVEHLSNLQAIFERLGQYFDESSQTSIRKITKSSIELSLEAANFLIGLSSDIETLIKKLEGLRSISFFALKDVEKIEDEVNKLIIDLDLIPRLNSDNTKSVVTPLNEKLQELTGKIGELKGKINKNKRLVERSVKDNQEGINSFLSSAGYKYEVVIRSEGDSYKMKLLHKEFNEDIEIATQHLSYGEKNAFALVLFMYQVLREQPSLVILDDPVSSFDKTKKFAILNELFRGKASLKNTTVLMLTHDIEPAIDIIRGVKNLFQNPKPTASFLASKSGVVKEVDIKENDIQTFSQICIENIQSTNDPIIKCIYLRRHFEIINDKGVEYNYLANLLHARDRPINKNSSGEDFMDLDAIELAQNSIRKLIPDFDYGAILSLINDKEALKNKFINSTIGYEKIQLFRIYSQVHMKKIDDLNSVFKKFINESFHIENEYMMQLNPHKFDNIPEYLIQESISLVASN